MPGQIAVRPKACVDSGLVAVGLIIWNFPAVRCVPVAVFIEMDFYQMLAVVTPKSLHYTK
jgi:hypothetical protein